MAEQNATLKAMLALAGLLACMGMGGCTATPRPTLDQILSDLHRSYAAEDAKQAQKAKEDAAASFRDRYPGYVSDGHCAVTTAKYPDMLDWCEDRAAEKWAYEKKHQAEVAAEAPKKRAQAIAAAAQAKKEKAEYEANAAKGEPKIGMTKSQTSDTSWYNNYQGSHSTEVGTHTHEQLVFGPGYSPRYLYFTDGILTAIQR